MPRRRPPHVRQLLRNKEYLAARGFALGLLRDGLIDEEECSKLCSSYALSALAGFWSAGTFHTAVVVLTNASSSPWAVPSNFNKNNNTIEALGPGCKGSNGGNGTTSAGGAGGRGGSGAAYTKLTNFDPAGATTIPFSIPLGNVVNPADTTFNTSSIVAKAGSSTAGGAAASCTPSAGAHSGGTSAAGGAANNSGGVGGGGGGSAGSTGDGAAASGQTHGAKGTGTFADGTTRQSDGADGANSPGQDLPGINGGAAADFGGGGGGGSGGGQAVSAGTRSAGTGGNAGGGIILIQYVYFA